MALSSLFLYAALAAGPPQARILGYELRLEVTPAERLVVGVAELELQAVGAELLELPFTLNRALRLEGVTIGGRAGKPRKAERVAEGQGWTLPLVPPLADGETARVRFEYRGTGADPDEREDDWMGVLLVREDEVRMSHQAQWYPVVPLDGAAAARLSAPTTLELVLPVGFASLGPGELVGVTADGERETHRWRSADAVQPSLLAGRYVVQEVRAGAQVVRALCFPGHEDGARRWAGEAAKALRVLERLYGSLDGRGYAVAEMRVRNRERSYAYEADGFSVYDSALFDGRDPDPRKVAHEVAHLWFGGRYDPSGPGERFLVESAAEAAAFCYLEAEYGEAAAVEAAARAAARYFDGPGEELPLVETGFGSPRYAQVVYGKGALALRTLRAWAGPDEFDMALLDHLERCRAGKAAASLDGFLAALRRPLGDEVDAWERDWLRKAGAPRYSVEYETHDLGGGRTRVSGHLLQSPRTYRTSVELGLVSASGRTAHVRVLPREGRSRFEAVVQQDVAEVVIDPRHLSLCERE